MTNPSTTQKESSPASLPARASWALYDFANTIFSMNVTTLYFAVWLVTDVGVSNTVVALGNGLASALVVVSIPPLAAISDRQHRRAWWVISFTVVSCVATALIGVLGQTMLPLFETQGRPSLGPAGQNHVPLASLSAVLAAFVVANYAYQAALPFYNAMLAELVPSSQRGRLSGVGTAVGYVGTIVGLLLVAPFVNGSMPLIGFLSGGVMTVLHTLFPYTRHGGRVSTFVPTAILFLLFSIPFAVFCRTETHSGAQTRIAWQSDFTGVGQLMRRARRYPGILRLIVASFIYQDAIGTIVSFMALYAVEAVGFERGSEQTLFLVLTVPAIAGSYMFGRIVDRIGPKRTLVFAVSSWALLLVGLVIAPSKSAFWLIGGLIGFNFGGVGTAERPLLLTLVPEAEAGAFFGLMLLSARAAAVVGPLAWGLTVDGLTPHFGKNVAYRAAVATVATSMTVALVLLRQVPVRSVKSVTGPDVDVIDAA
ncbi:MAG: MFS transporter [Chloroflexota bacterium]